jgi:hypothetical protein
MTLLQDLRYAIRTASRDRAFTLVAVLTLALGIGANTALFTIVNAVVLAPLPFRSPDQLVRVTADFTRQRVNDIGLSIPELLDLRHSGVFADIAGVWPVSANLTETDEPERVETALVDANYFSMLGVAAQVGRVFTWIESPCGGRPSACYVRPPRQRRSIRALRYSNQCRFRVQGCRFGVRSGFRFRIQGCLVLGSAQNPEPGPEPPDRNLTSRPARSEAWGSRSGFVIDEPRFAIEGAAVAGQRAGRSDHAVTRHDDRDRVRTICGADRARRTLRPQRLRDRPVTRRPAGGNGEERRPHALLERGAAHVERQILADLGRRAVEVAASLRAPARWPVPRDRPPRAAETSAAGASAGATVDPRHPWVP